MEHRAEVDARLSMYREFAPSPALRDYVRAIAWYGPVNELGQARAPMREFYLPSDTALTPSFADAQTCVLFALGVSYAGKGWQPSSTIDATVMGAMTHATPPGAERPAMIAVYLKPRGSAALLRGTAAELTDRIVSLSDVRNGCAISPERLSLDTVEAVLARRLSATSLPDRAVRIAELASHVRRYGGRISVAQMAELTGLSRQHLGRLFLEYVGVGPKLYARLARFRAALRQLGDERCTGSWSRVAAQLGYADQSHLIADFREFTSFTPEQLARGRHFHPFIGDDSNANH